MTERMEVEHIVSNQQVIKALDNLLNRMEKVEKVAKKTSDTSKKGADAAAGSFNALEQELKQNEAALKGMVRGTQAFAQQKARVDSLRRSYLQAKQGLATHNAEASKLTQLGAAGIAKIAGMVAGVASLNTVVQSVVQELEKARNISIKAAGTERTLEQALADIAQNTSGEQLPAARMMIEREAPALGTTQQGLANLLGTAISAGAKDLNEALSVTSAALKLTVGDAERANAIIGGALDIASLGQSQNFEGAIGQLLQVQSQVRSTNMSEFAKNIGPAIAASAAQGQNVEGLSTERALEISAVVSQILKDQTGSNTATAVRQFVTRMDSFMPELEKTLDDGGKATLTKEQVAAFAKERSFDARIEMMRAIPALALQFLETQREGIGKTAVREIVHGTNLALGFEQKAGAAITGLDDARQRFVGDVEAIRGQTGLLLTKRQADADIERRRTEGPQAVAGTVREIVGAALEEVNLPGFDYLRQKYELNRLEAKIAAGGEETAVPAGIETLRRAQRSFVTGDIIDDGRTRQGLNDAIGRLQQLLSQQAAIVEQQNRNLQAKQPIVVQAPAARPKEDPVPAVTIP